MLYFAIRVGRLSTLKKYMKYLKNPQTNEIVKGEAFGAFFDSWIELTQEEIDVYELQQAKIIKLQELYSARLAFQYKDVIYNNTNFAGTERACNNLGNTVLIMQNSNLVYTEWLTAEGNPIALSLTEAQGLLQTMFNQQSRAYFQEVDYKTLINNATSIEEVNQIVIDFTV